jgi:anti-sigma regulatory factor (Ser/Thr protein kinase)
MRVENTRTSAPNHFVHRAAFYASEEELLAIVVPIVEEALNRDVPVAVISSEHTEGKLRAVLGGSTGLIHLPPPQAHLRCSGQGVITRRARELRELTDWAGAVEVITEHHPHHPEIEATAWVEAEAAMNVALTMLPITMTCLYPTGHSSEAVDAVRWNHPQLIEVGGTIRDNIEVRTPADVLAMRPAPAPVELGLPHQELRFDTWQLIELRKAVAEATTAVGLEVDRAQDFVLAVNEVASNAVEHGYGIGELQIWCHNDELICEVHNNGPLTEPLPGLRPPHPNSARGRGMWIARQLCDLLHVWTDASGTHVRLQTSRH